MQFSLSRNKKLLHKNSGTNPGDHHVRTLINNFHALRRGATLRGTADPKRSQAHARRHCQPNNCQYSRNCDLQLRVGDFFGKTLEVMGGPNSTGGTACGALQEVKLKFASQKHQKKVHFRR